MVVTIEEAKELLIGGMNYAAYKETNYSLYASDKNKLFEAEHYSDGDRPIVAPSPWGEGEEFESKMAQLLSWAIQLGSTKGDYKEALRTLRNGKHFLNRIIERAGLENV